MARKCSVWALVVVSVLMDWLGGNVTRAKDLAKEGEMATDKTTEVGAAKKNASAVQKKQTNPGEGPRKEGHAKASKAIPQTTDFRVTIHEHKTALPNAIWFIPSDRKVVTMSLVFRHAGTKNSNAKHPSLPRFFGPMFTKGAGKYDAYQFQRKLIECGASFSCDLDVDDAVCSFWCPEDTYEDALSLSMLLLTKPRLPSSFLRKLQKEALVDLKESLKDPRTVAHDARKAFVFPEGHPYRCQLKDVEKDINAVSVRDIKQHLSLFTQENAIVVVLGPSNKEKEIVAAVVKALQVLPSKGAPAPLRADSSSLPQEGGAIVRVDFDVPQTVIMGMSPGFSINDPKYYAKKLAFQAVAGSSLGARLLDEIRTKRGLVYAVNGWEFHGDLCDVLFFYAGSKQESADEAVRAIKEVFEKVCAKGITQKEFVKTRQTYMDSSIVQLDSSQMFVGYVTTSRLRGRSIEQIREMRERLAKTSLQDVNEACKELFSTSGLSFVCVGRPIASDKNATKQGRKA